jgi:hypothetical protein
MATKKHGFSYLLWVKATQDRPITAMVRFGERFLGDIEWQEETKMKVWLAQDVNADCEAGVDTEAGGTGYAGYDPETMIFWRYSDDVQDGKLSQHAEHCMRIFKVLSTHAPRKVASSTPDDPKELEEIKAKLVKQGANLD